MSPPESLPDRSEPVLAVALTRDEAEWLESAARRASEDTLVPEAAAPLRALAVKLRWPERMDSATPDDIRRGMED